MLFDGGWRWRAHDRSGQASPSRWRSVATAVAAFVLLVVVWELVKVVVPADGVTLGGTRVLPRTSDAAMPHVWTVLGRLVDPEVVGAAQPRSVGAAVALGALFTLRLALGGLVLGGVLGVLLALLMQRSGLARARAAALRRRLADRAADRDRPARRRLGRQDRGVRAAVAAVGERHGDRGLPGVLPDRGGHAARPDLAAHRRTSSCSGRWPAAGGRRCCGCGCRRPCRS